MHEVIPAILPKTEKELVDNIRRLEPHVDRVHIDIADGKFVPNTTIRGLEELDRLKTNLKIDVHLMIDDPYSQMYQWYNIGGIDRFIVHAEARNGLSDLLEQVKLNSKEVGLAVNPETQMDDVWDYLERIDMLQIMTVDPGFQGGAFRQDVLYKISTLRERELELPVAVDGGINPATAKLALIAGASTLVCGSYIINSQDIERAIQALREL